MASSARPPYPAPLPRRQLHVLWDELFMHPSNPPFWAGADASPACPLLMASRADTLGGRCPFAAGGRCARDHTPDGVAAARLDIMAGLRASADARGPFWEAWGQYPIWARPDALYDAPKGGGPPEEAWAPPPGAVVLPPPLAMLHDLAAMADPGGGPISVVELGRKLMAEVFRRRAGLTALPTSLAHLEAPPEVAAGEVSLQAHPTGRPLWGSLAAAAGGCQPAVRLREADVAAWSSALRAQDATVGQWDGRVGAGAGGGGAGGGGAGGAVDDAPLSRDAPRMHPSPPRHFGGGGSGGGHYDEHPRGGGEHRDHDHDHHRRDERGGGGGYYDTPPPPPRGRWEEDRGGRDAPPPPDG